MMSEALHEEKKNLRRQVLEQRRQLKADWVAGVSAQISENILAWRVYQQANCVMCYLSMKDEPQTDNLILNALNSGKQVCVPKLRQCEFGVMDAVAISGLDDFTSGRLGLREPREDNVCIVDPQAIDLILVPGVAFDKCGNRLGMGAGYYDRFLAQAGNAILAGLVWDFQVVAAIPAMPHDIPMQYLLTECGIEKCR